MRRLLLLVITLSSLLLARNDVPSCYDALKINSPHGVANKELFILIDQTTIIDRNMMKYTYQNMMNFMKNGSAVTIASFSSNSNGKYTDLVYSGKIERLLPKEAQYSISKKTLRKYEGCMAGQSKFAKKKAKKALGVVLKGASKKLPHSDIIKSLEDISKNIIEPSSSKEKIVLLVSDMIEHSSITSFYSKGALKLVNTKRELSKVLANKAFGNFAGARVYVIGTAVLGKKGYRDTKTLTTLTSFWKAYFKGSKAKLKEMGTPMLLRDVR